MYTINGNLMHMDRSGNYIMHGAKGSEWKTHKYVDKILKNGKWVYTYAKNSLGSAKNKLTNLKNYSKNRDKLLAIDKKNKKYNDMANKMNAKGDRAYDKFRKNADRSTKAMDFYSNNAPINVKSYTTKKGADGNKYKFLTDKREEHQRYNSNGTPSIVGKYLDKAEEAEKKAQIARVDKDMDAYNKYQKEAQDNYTRAKAVEQNAKNQKDLAYNKYGKNAYKAYKEMNNARNAENYYAKKANEHNDERSDIYNKMYGDNGVPIKVQDVIDKLDEGKAKASKAISSANSKVKETTDNVKKKTKETASKAIKTADKVATKATDEFVSRIIDSMERANVKKAEVKPAEVKPITLKENVLKENILKENVLKENVIGEKKRKKKR